MTSMMEIERDYSLTGGAICLDFVATLRSRSGRRKELLDGVEALRYWLALTSFDLGRDGDKITLEDLYEARELREAIFRVLEAMRQGDEPKADDVQSLNTAARAHVPVPRLVRDEGDGGFVQKWPEDMAVSSVLSAIARDAIAMVVSDEPERLKLCDNSECARMFWDDSQARRRRWCSMERCGNKSKISRYRSRHKTNSPSEA